MQNYYKPLATTKIYSSAQRGSSVSGIVYLLLSMGIFVKLIIAIVPAQVGDYQVTKDVAEQLQKANAENESAKEFINRLKKRWMIDANNHNNPDEMFTFTNAKPGNLIVHKNYTVVNNFIGNVDIINKFEGDISGKDAE